MFRMVEIRIRGDTGRYGETWGVSPFVPASPASCLWARTGVSRCLLAAPSRLLLKTRARARERGPVLVSTAFPALPTCGPPSSVCVGQRFASIGLVDVC